ncbi:MAG: flagellar basal body-associated FliL family protein [Gemmatirosa sp.]
MAASPEPDTPSAEQAPPPRASKLFVILAIVGGIAAGGAAGAFAVGPLVAQKLAPAAAGADSAQPVDDDEHAEGEGKEGEAAARPVHTLENLVLNPAESGGQRFLLLTIAFELKDAATLETMKARDAELRDVVLQAVGAKSVEVLTDMSQRDSLKSELRTVAGKLFPDTKHAVRRIYFPQFVIQ